MTRPYRFPLCLAAGFITACSPAARTQSPVCAVTDSVREALPAEPAPAGPYVTLPVTGPSSELKTLGVGHLHYSSESREADAPPGADNWLERVELPLSSGPGAPPSAWIVRGWIVRDGAQAAALTTHGLVETGYEEPSFVVLERRSDGWLHIQYSTAEDSVRSAWTPGCALATSPARLQFTPWRDWLLSDRVTPLFFRAASPDELRDAPSSASTRLTAITAEDALEPKEIRGEWMRVTLKQPSDYCRPEVTSVTREGWVRWYAPPLGPRVWYFTRGC